MYLKMLFQFSCVQECIIKKLQIAGVGHTEDLGYIFDFGKEGTKVDYLVRNRFVRLLTNFAKYRNPTPRKDNLLNHFYWPANSGVTNVVQLNITDELQLVTGSNSNNMDFWEDIFEKNGSPPFDTF